MSYRMHRVAIAAGSLLLLAHAFAGTTAAALIEQQTVVDDGGVASLTGTTGVAEAVGATSTTGPPATTILGDITPTTLLDVVVPPTTILDGVLPPTTIPDLVVPPTTLLDVVVSPTTTRDVVDSTTTTQEAVVSPTTTRDVVVAPTTTQDAVVSPTTVPTVVVSPTTVPTVVVSPTTVPAVVVSPTTLPTVMATPTTAATPSTGATVAATPTTIPEVTTVPSMAEAVDTLTAAPDPAQPGNIPPASADIAGESVLRSLGDSDLGTTEVTTGDAHHTNGGRGEEGSGADAPLASPRQAPGPDDVTGLQRADDPGGLQGAARPSTGPSPRAILVTFEKAAAVVAEASGEFSFPLSIAAAVLLFLSVQGRIDRRDPKLAAPLDDHELEFR